VLAERALARAARIDRIVADGDDPGPLAGVPFAAKNLFDVAGIVTRAGSRVKIWLEPDLVERPVVLPTELVRALNAVREVRKLFDSMTPSRRREFGKFADQPKSLAARTKRAEKIAEMLMHALEGQHDPPPIIRALFPRHPGSRDAWFALTPAQRRNHLLGIFYYETAEARERRATKAIDAALRAARRTGR